MNRGYVKLWRKVEDTGLDLRLRGLLLTILIEASYNERTVYVSGVPVKLSPGQFIYGRGSWSAKLGCSEKVLRNLNRAVSAERELAELRRQHEAIPRIIRIVCRMLRGKG